MRIVFLITMGTDRPSGLRYFHIARELVRLGHSVRILALHPDLESCSQRRFIRDGVEVWYVGQMHARKSGTIPIRFTPFQLLRVLIRSTLGMIWGVLCSPADVYHLGKPQPVNGLAALLAISLLGRRFYVDCDDDEVGSNRLTSDWQRAVFRFWQWLLPRLSIGVTVNTRFIADRLAQQGIEPIVYVPNGADRAAAHPRGHAALIALRDALNLRGRQVVAYAGTLALHNHPVDLLLDAFQRIAADLPDLHLLLIGGGEDLPELRRRAHAMSLHDRVHFTGHLAHESVHTFLSLADVSVDPVYDDDVARARSPLKIFESMVVGVPIITGDVGDRRVLLADGVGIVTAPGDVGALADALRSLLSDPAQIQASATAAALAASTYSWREMGRRWVTVYHSPSSW